MLFHCAQRLPDAALATPGRAKGARNYCIVIGNHRENASRAVSSATGSNRVENRKGPWLRSRCQLRCAARRGSGLPSQADVATQEKNYNVTRNAFGHLSAIVLLQRGGSRTVVDSGKLGNRDNTLSKAVAPSRRASGPPRQE